jgi:hypothetical protein
MAFGGPAIRTDGVAKPCNLHDNLLFQSVACRAPERMQAANRSAYLLPRNLNPRFYFPLGFRIKEAFHKGSEGHAQ